MKYGYNLFSAWELTKDRDSLISVMKQLKQMGYDGVEFFLYFDIPAKEMKQIVDEIGLIPFSAHPRLFRFFDNLDEEIAYAKTVGIETLVMPHIPEEDRNEGYYQKVLEAIPQWYRKCNEAGIRLAWHNHEFEFLPYQSEKWLMEAILKENPEIEYEIDTFWTTFSGVDTIAFMEKWRDRIHYIHFKDYEEIKGDGKAWEDISFCAVGTGRVDVQAVAEQAKKMDVEWAVVEQDNSKIDCMESARISLKNLKNLFAEGEK